MKKRFSILLAMTIMTIAAMAQTVVVGKTSSDVYGKASTLKAAPRKAAEVRDENGIIVTPASGEEVTFNRTGGGVLLLSGFSTSEGVQNGTSKFVFCDDGTVYWNHPLCDALEAQRFELTDTWVKGKLEGETITFAPGQPITCGTRPPYTKYVLYMCDLDESGSIPDAMPVKDEPIVLKFSRGGKVLELQNSSKKHMLGVFSSTTGYSAGSHWDFGTSFTRDTTGEHDPAVTLPAGVSTTQYISNGYDAATVYDPDVETSYPIGNVSFSSQLGFDGNVAYLSNFSYYGIDHWLKGTRQADGSIVFPKEQYILTTPEDHYDLYVYALPHGSNNAADATDLVLTYNATTGDYVSNQDIFINYEKMGDKLERVERIENFKLLSYNDVPDAPIFNAPKGYRQVSYDCHGQFLASTMGWLNNGQEGTTVDVAYNPDGNDVYLKSPCASILDPWIKGTKDADGKLHFPTMQYVQKDPDYGNLRTGVFVRKWIYESRYQYTYEWDPSIKEVTFSVDDDGFLTLDPLHADQKDGEMPPLYTYGFVRGTDEFSWSGYCEAYTIYTPIEGSETITGEGEDPDQPVNPGGEDGDKIDISKLCPGEVHNSYGIITAPGTGTEYTYNRAGGNYAYVANDIEEGTQSGVIHLVETEDGYIFMQQPISTYSKAYAATAWIKGVKKDGQYIFPEGQVINYDAYWESALVVCMGEYDSTDGTFMPNHQRNIVFDITDDGNTLTLQNTSSVKPLALFYEDDDAWVGYGDFNTVLTYKSGGLIEEKVEPSWKAERLNYTLTATDIDPIEGGFKGYNAVLAFEGDDVYLGNFSYWLDYYHDETGKYIWIKGKKRADGSLFFPREQYLYSFEQMGDNWDLFFYGCTEPVEGAYSPSDLVFTYDEANERYTAQQDILITFGRITTSIPRAEQLNGAVLVRDKNDGTRPYIIDEQPEGELRSYSRSGFAFEFINGGIYESNQSGKDIEFVFAPDGKTVFMHTPISGAITSNGINTADSWVAGTLDENGNIFVPLNQWISYDDELGYGARTGAFVYTEDDGTSSYLLVQNLIAFTFTFNPADGSYSLDRLESIDYTTSSPRVIYGAYWTNDYTWTGLGDFDSVYTPNFPWTPDEDGIANVTIQRNDETYYDFQGRHARPDHGLYIKSGRKVMLR